MAKGAGFSSIGGLSFIEVASWVSIDIIKKSVKWELGKVRIHK